MENKTIDSILEERGKRYGDFKNHAKITQRIKEVYQDYGSWDNLTDSQREALEMKANKIGRIINGDPNYSDSWKDISGYA